ncbi:GNAT family N-acetyltransferase [Streptomyces alanosinicus]|uniref:Lysine N-acyltransferase MbtK n=1 Tax=Streptomyces alanosinicus TaxID=68171 RepID=A0A918YHX5_9ACTN|nr:GNAT family N-acetyltransferase [Streptomyces alanosinicus]GHE03574.1 acetyltransferase [Streptomyces alanosinicus]
MTDPRAHLYEQHVPGFGTVRIRPLDPAGDADVIHRWVSEERAVFWGMTGLTRDEVAEIYTHMAGLDTHHALLVTRDDAPAALLQTYEPAADRVGECYDVLPGDLGVHVLLAPAGPAGGRPGWASALLAAMTTYALRTLDRQRLVVDPDIRNTRAIARFEREGFVRGPAVVLPEVDLPDVHLPRKHAQLAFLPRTVALPGD